MNWCGEPIWKSRFTCHESPGETAVSDVRPDEITESRWQPADFGVAAQPLDSLRVDGPAASAAMIRRVLAGEQGPPQDIVVLNAAVALIVAGKHDEPTAAAAAASEAISSGEASRLLHRLAERSHA